MIQLFNRIIYIADGVFKESGLFEELLKMKGMFFSAWEDYQRKVVSGGEKK
jgi:ABC-type multidrug transport system fused ATPase/permease subunit